MVTINKPLPLEYIVNKIKNFPILSGNEKLDFLQKIISVHTFLSVETQTDDLYRVRKIEANYIASNVKEALWPKINGCNDTQSRIDLGLNESVCYLAKSSETALAETVKQGMATVLLAQFKNMSPIHLISIGEIDLIVRTGEGRMIKRQGRAEIFLEDFTKALNGLAREDGLSMIIADSFLFEQLALSPDREITNFISRELCNKYTEADAISYPSTKRRDSLNLAVKTSNFWKKWGVLALQKAHISCLACGYYEIIPKEDVNEIYPNGALSWIDGNDTIGEYMPFDTPFIFD